MDEVARTRVEPEHTRPLTTIFGEVAVERLAYRARGVPNLYPADAVLNLPVEKHSHGLRRLAAIESTRGSFDEAAAAITRASGVRVGKRQVEELAAAAAFDVPSFYAAARRGPSPDTDPLVLSADGKGVVMRPESLRDALVGPPPAATTSSPPGSLRVRSGTVSGWPRWGPSTTAAPPLAPRTTSSPPRALRVIAHRAPDPDRPRAGSG